MNVALFALFGFILSTKRGAVHSYIRTRGQLQKNAFCSWPLEKSLRVINCGHILCLIDAKPGFSRFRLFIQYGAPLSFGENTELEGFFAMGQADGGQCADG